MMKTNIKKKTGMRFGTVITLIIAFAVAASLVLSTARFKTNAFAEDVEHEVVGGNYFLSDYDTKVYMPADPLSPFVRISQYLYIFVCLCTFFLLMIIREEIRNPSCPV